jgi:hypothetical protein
MSEVDAERMAALVDGDEDSVESLEQLMERMRSLRSSAASGNMSDADRRHQAENLIMHLLSHMHDEDGDDEIQDTDQ